MLNPQRTLERGYAVILGKDQEGLHAVRKPSELSTENLFQIRLAEGEAEVQFSEVKR
jgi:exodeoxyribonuclease VII large subunit